MEEARTIPHSSFDLSALHGANDFNCVVFAQNVLRVRRAAHDLFVNGNRQTDGRKFEFDEQFGESSRARFARCAVENDGHTRTRFQRAAPKAGATGEFCKIEFATIRAVFGASKTPLRP